MFKDGVPCSTSPIEPIHRNGSRTSELRLKIPLDTSRHTLNVKEMGDGAPKNGETITSGSMILSTSWYVFVHLFLYEVQAGSSVI